MLNAGKYIFLGCTQFSKEILECLIDHEYLPSAIFTIPKRFNISYSSQRVENTNFCDLSVIGEKYGISTYEIDSKKGNKLGDYYQLISDLNLDFILVMGWYYILPKKIRLLAKHGAWGIHASLLPKYAGGAPLVWAMIHGEEDAGVTLFRMDEGVDSGDIIAQKSFPIERYDTIKEVYAKAAGCSKKILIKSLSAIDSISYTQQNLEEIERFSQRSPDDGEIDLSWSAEKIVNFIRAQTEPYPGAFIKLKDGTKLTIKSVEVTTNDVS